jgi:hypothetical protein
MLKISKTKATHQNDPLKKNVTSGIMMKGALDYCKKILQKLYNILINIICMK